MKEDDGIRFPTTVYIRDSSEEDDRSEEQIAGVTRDSDDDESQERRFERATIFSDLALSPIPHGVSPRAINLFECFKHGLENTDIDPGLVIGKVLEILLKRLGEEEIRRTWDQVEDGVLKVLYEPSAKWESLRARWVEGAEKKQRSSEGVVDLNSYCMECLINFAKEEIREALRRLEPEQNRVIKQVERYLILLEEQGELGKWELARKKGYIWYRKDWEPPHRDPDDLVRELSRRCPKRSLDEVKEEMDEIPVSPISPSDEFKRIEEGGRAKPVFDYEAYLPSRILAALDLFSAPLHTSQIKEVILSCLSRWLDPEESSVRRSDLYGLRDPEGDRAVPDDARDEQTFGESYISPEDSYIQEEEKAVRGSHDDRLSALMYQPAMNDRRRQILNLLVQDPKLSRNKTELARRVGCSRNTLAKDLDFLGDLIGFRFDED